jgi:hypothetical protein
MQMNLGMAFKEVLDQLTLVSRNYPNAALDGRDFVPSGSRLVDLLPEHVFIVGLRDGGAVLRRGQSGGSE